MSLSRGLVTVFLGHAVPLVAALAAQPILAQGLGLTGRGEVAAATAPLQFATVILTLGLPESLTYHVAKSARGIARAIRISIGTLVLAGFAGCATISVLALPLSGGNPALAQLIIIATSGIVPALVVAALRGIALGHQAWRLVTIERAASSILRLVAIGGLFLNDSLTPLSATVALAATTFAGGVAYLGLARRNGGKEFNGPNTVDGPALLRYASQIWLGSAAGILLLRLDQLLITPLSSVDQLGLYVVAAALSEATLVINSAVRDVMFVVESNDPDANRVGRASRTSTLITLILVAVVGCSCPWIIPFLFGSGFTGAVPATIILLIGVVLGNPGSVAAASLSARGRPGLRSASMLVAAVINVGGVFALVPPLGAVGAALAMLISQFVSGNLAILLLRVIYKVKLSEFYRPRRTDVTDLWFFVRRLRRG
ncbi:oligosaccharide flippase family protein [Mycolicibacterium sp. F2034L]|uniref:oligosaccharide flippase family protein n=1 Tax=Mycolicibacterium sp. F2034L TaxID=2926422 RepID=UPI001FF282C0|nr:oligosaccharide flippase family protein [Mycolicibacterium sp. F2034L]MCK0173776.1 oligosaccharide flippase family protein [Mycolicibacterium sp. F2034L]